ncbi:class I SAM-dependent methyltransferase [Treponema pedis]|nr:class I SAM-dependent methyltransferase [Treponema pedis]
MEEKTHIIDFFNELANRWDDIAENNERSIDFIVEYADLKPECTVLDIGCGTGILESRILKFNPKKILAIDISMNMILKAKQKFKDSRIEFLNADIYTLCENGFDRAFIFNAYPHFIEKENLAEKLYGCLKQNGRFIIAHDHSRHEVNSRHDKTIKREASVSFELKSAEEEAVIWKKFFKIDTLIDKENLYMISGVKNNIFTATFV